MGRSRRVLAGGAGLAAAAVLSAGCGDDDGNDTTAAKTGTTAPAGPVTETVRVSETDFRLTPANPTLPRPGTVEFIVTNNGQTTHALEVEGPGGEAETEPIAPGKSARLRVELDRPGSYTWYCPIGNHRRMGMAGKVKVASGEARGGSGERGTQGDERGGQEREDAQPGGESGGARYGY